MSAGQFATARRGIHPEDLKYAQTLLNKGYGFQNVARITSICEDDLRTLCNRGKQRASVPIPRRRQDAPQISVHSVNPARDKHHAASKAPVRSDTRLVLAAVAHRYDVSISDLVGPSRVRRIAWARQEAMSVLRETRANLSLPIIGRIFGGRDHTTILTGIRRYEARKAWAEFLIAAGQPEQPSLPFWSAAA